jgi:carboxyl-terminal processing protease
MTARTRLFVLLISAPVFAFAVVGGFLGKVVAREETYQHLRVFEDVLSLITGNYVEDVNVDRVMHGAMHGLTDALDPDSAYLDVEQVRSVERGAGLPEGDIGVELTRQYYLRIVSARDDSPAARAGLRPGDYLRIIDRQPTRDMSVWEGVRLLRGQPGTPVTLTIIRGNAAEPHVVTVTREKLVPVAPSTKIVAPGIGYLRIAEFTASLAPSLGARIATLKREGATHLIIDLRSTARGPVDAGLAAARLFVPSGTLALLETRNVPRQTISAQPGDGAETLPTVLLVDAGTSGAAELFAAALAGNKRGIVIGEKTEGRTALQHLLKLQDGSGIWLSYAWYLTPSAAVLHDKGLVPDVEVEVPDVEFGGTPPSEDVILRKAIEHFGRPSSVS